MIIHPDDMPNIVTPEVRRGATSMFARMKKKQRDRAEEVAVSALKPLVSGGGTQIAMSAGGDKYFLYTQGAAATVWTVTHNFGRYPNITVLDNTGEQIEAQIRHTNVNELTVTFNAAFDGQAFLS